jgi:hypothetical protein
VTNAPEAAGARVCDCVAADATPSSPTPTKVTVEGKAKSRADRESASKKAVV